MTVIKDEIAQRRSQLAARRAGLSAAKQQELEKLLKERSAEGSPARVIPGRPQGEPIPLSFAQQRLWFLDQFEPGRAIYNIPIAFRLSGPLNLAALEQSLKEAIRRHESLRTNFANDNGHPVQIIAATRDLDLPLADLRSLPLSVREAEARRLAGEHGQRPFDLAEDSLLRLSLLRLDEQEHTLLVTMHHIISDGWSMQVLIREVGTLYNAFCGGEPSPLPELAVQYADYAHWQRQYLQGETLEAELAYWKSQLQDIPPVLNLPTDRSRPPVMSFRGGSREIVVEQALTDELRRLTDAEGVTLFVTLLASFQMLLSRYSGQDDIVVGTPIAGRRWVETEELIGFFVNTLIMRTRLDGNPGIREVLRRVREVALEAQTHQEVPFERLVEELQPERSLSYGPLFQVLFALQNVPKTILEVEQGLSLSQEDFNSGVEKFTLSLFVSEERHRLVCLLSYSTDLFDETTIERMAGHWVRMLEGMVEDAGQRASEVGLLSEQEREQILVEWNSTGTEYDEQVCAHEIFEQQVERAPDEVAVIFEDQRLSYRELNRRANQLAHHLRKMGVGPDARVAVFAERSLEMVAGVMGILKAGGAYVPIDPTYPKERVLFILEDAQAAVVLTQERLRGSLPEHLAPAICLDSDWQMIAQQPDANPTSMTNAEDLAYVIYTSGSTGIARGVMVEHRSVVNLAMSLREIVYPRQQANLHVSLNAPIVFDSSVKQLVQLLYGHTLCIVPEDVRRDAEEMLSYMKVNKVDVLDCTPSQLRLLLAAGFPEVLEQPPTIALIGGEPIDEASWKLLARSTRTTFYNVYGPTECTVDSTVCKVETTSSNPSIGRPIPNAQVYLLDNQLRPIPIGVTGELHIGGSGLARGYLGRAELTAELFVPDPFSQHPGARLYKSGDLARYRPDGNIEFLGRIDHQVKIRGHRIELGEVEAALKGYPQVRSAVVLDREDGQGDRRLVAYIVPDQKSAPSINELQHWLKQQLPDYMVPSAWVLLDEIPLTTNGKVDRDALPEPGRARVDTGQSFVAPRTMIEEVLAAIWEEVLDLEEVGRDDNFFWIGGHSLLATRVISRMRESFQVELPVRSLFETPTLAGLAEHIEATMRAGSSLSAPLLRPVSGDKMLPLSYAQQRLWFLDQLMPGSSAYNIPTAVEMNVELNAHALEQCLSEIARRHQVLRTTFTIAEGRPVQNIGRAEPLTVPLVDLSGLSDEEQQAQLDRLRQDEAQKPFDLSKGPLLRVSLLRLGRQRHVVLVTMHHIVSDGWSMGVLMQEVKTLYDAFSTGLQSPLEELEFQYADYAQWQREWLQGEFLKAELDYWRPQLADAPTLLKLETDHPRPAMRTVSGARCPVVFSEDLSQSLREFSRREGATLFMTLMAGFQALLWRYTGQDHILVGTPVAGRSRVELEDLIGFFVNMAVLRANLSGAPAFKELLKQVREAALGAYAHQELPFDKLVEELQPERSLGRNPLFQVILAFQNAPTPEMEMGGMTLPSGSPGNPSTKFDLEVFFWDTPGGVRGSFVYSPELFEETTIQRMVDHFGKLLTSVMADPNVSLSEVTLMDKTEFHQVVEEWNDTDVEFPADACIHELFEKQAEQTPDAIAVEAGQERLTYRELNQRANVLANYLRTQGVGPEVFVAILLERSPEMIAVLLAVAKAGGVYVPINLADPAVRIRFILKDAGVSTLVTTNQIAGNIPKDELNVVCVDSAERYKEMLGAESEENPVSGAMAENLAYVMYTSGSTGTPKGVCITHRNILRLVKSANYAELNSEQVFLQFAPVSFDASTFEIWGCLLNGARLVLFPPHTPTLSELGEFIAKSQVTTLWLTAGLFHQMVDGNLSGLSGVKQLLAGGDVLSDVHVKKALEGLKDCRLINCYGPTETTTFACCYHIEPNQLGASVPIGRPISNTRVYILNAMHPAAIGERGELYIGGEGLARGYLHRPDLTAERFLPDPFGSQPGARLYSTGDQARYLNQGDIEFLGRLDNQVKIRGFRIELGEIEAALSEHPAVKEIVILAREDTPGDKRLVAYVVTNGETVLSSEELKNYLRERLPEYMLPSVCVMLEALPLTPNGKVDRAALPAPDRSLISAGGNYIAPRDAVQQRLVEIWEELLKIHPIGVRDNFFELGGHSLLIVLLITRIEEQYGKRLPMAALFQEATIEHLSHLIHQEAETSSWSLLVPLQPNGANLPLFCPHAGGGHVLCYTGLARYLGDDQPLYGFQARESTTELVAHTQLEAMAADYIGVMRSFQPKGPYLLGGWSMGGVIAFEMARQLEQQGQEVALLALIDAEAPSARPAEYSWAVLLAGFARQLGLSSDNASVSWEEISLLPQMAQLRQVWLEAKANALVPSDTTLVEFRKIFDLYKTNVNTLRNYAGGDYQGRVTLFSAETRELRFGKEFPTDYFTNLEINQDGIDPRDPMKGWERLVNGGVEMHTVPGDHFSVIREPHVQVLAELLRDCAQKAVKGL